MPGARVSSVGGTLAGTNSAIGGLPRGEMRLDRRQMIGPIPVDDLRARGQPDTRMRQDIFDGGAERLDAVRLADPVRMQRDAHHPPVLRALRIDRVEIVP